MNHPFSKKSGPLNLVRHLSLAALLFGANTLGHAAEAASATISDTNLGGGEFDYTITLNDTGTTNLGTLWYSWVPGKDFMPVSPTNIVAPTNWTDIITHSGSSDGFAIQYVASNTAADVTPGGSLSFSFESTANPQQLSGNSPFFPTIPVGTSFVYSGAPFSDAGVQFDVAPEPSSSWLLLAGVVGLGMFGARKSLRSRFKMMSNPIC